MSSDQPIQVRIPENEVTISLVYPPGGGQLDDQGPPVEDPVLEAVYSVGVWPDSMLQIGALGESVEEALGSLNRAASEILNDLMQHRIPGGRE